MLDITTLAAWGEFIGGIAVLVSLIYLAGQVRQNTKFQRATTTIATAQMQNSYTPLMMQDAEISQIYWNGLEDYAALSEEDRRRFNPLMSMQFQGFSYRHQFQEEGIASPDAWEQTVRGMRWLFRSNPGARQWWREWRDVHPPRFCDFVDGLIREGKAAECERQSLRRIYPLGRLAEDLLH